MSVITSKPALGRATMSDSVGPLPAHGTLDEVIRLLHELKGDINEVRATLQTRRKDHYTVEEVAELTGRTPYTVRRWISEKRITAVRISGTGPKGRLLIPREELETLITAGLGAKIPDAAAD